MDLASDEQLARFKKFITEEKKLPYFEICAPILEGTKELMNYTAECLSKLPPIKHYEAEVIAPEELLEKETNSFQITSDGETYYVDAPFLIKVLNRVDMDDYESLQYFQSVLIKSGIIDALREKGISEGDTVNIYDFEFEFVN